MNWRRRRQWFVTTTLFTIFVSAALVYKLECGINNSIVNYKPPLKALLSVKFQKHFNNVTSTESLRWHLSSKIPNHVTKSMAQLGKMDEVNEHFLFLNSVPKSGSEILIYLLEHIHGINNFKHVRLKGSGKQVLTTVEQEELVDEVYDIRRNLAVPLSFDRSVHFVNFTAFDKQLPIYINLIRHPVTKALSRPLTREAEILDNFLRCVRKRGAKCRLKNGETQLLSIPYFCGHDSKCRLPNSNWALERAKQNVVKYYRVVGVLEELNTTLAVLETLIPQFFKGASLTYTLLDIYRSKKEPSVSADVRTSLEKVFSKEIEFYQWIKSRLLEQSNKITIV